MRSTILLPPRHMTGGAATVYVHEDAQECDTGRLHTCRYWVHDGNVRIAVFCLELNT